MRKIKIFRSSDAKDLEDSVNEWLEENYDKMSTQPNITYLQSSADPWTLTTVIIDYYFTTEEEE